jgi:hypothetical protein
MTRDLAEFPPCLVMPMPETPGYTALVAPIASPSHTATSVAAASDLLNGVRR